MSAPPPRGMVDARVPKSGTLYRRAILAGFSACLLPTAGAAAPEPLAELERTGGGRLGVYAIDTGSGRSLAHRADERFLMCSTFKLLLAAVVLARVDAGQERLDRRVAYTGADLLGHAPVSRAHVAEGALPVGALCQAAVVESDNTAANLLLSAVGGPPAVTQFARAHGDAITRLDRTELALNEPDGESDTTTPRAMSELVRAVLLGQVLRPGSRAMLDGWTAACTTGVHRLRAGLPAAWVAGDKTGTSDTMTNDLAVIRLPGRAPLVVAAYHEGGPNGIEGREAMLRAVGSAVARWAA